MFHVAKPMPLTEEPQIKRTRTTFIVLNGVLLGLCIGGLMTTLFQSTVSHSAERIQQAAQDGLLITSILYCSFGILVAYKYHRTGLCVYAILGIISLVLIGIVVIGLLFLLHSFTSSSAGSFSGHMGAIAFIAAALLVGILIASIVSFIVSIILVKLALKLARLLDAHQRFNDQQI